MSHSVRMALAIAGLIFIAVSVAALVYVLWPDGTLQEQFRPAPTLFAPPVSAAPWILAA